MKGFTTHQYSSSGINIILICKYFLFFDQNIKSAEVDEKEKMLFPFKTNWKTFSQAVG